MINRSFTNPRPVARWVNWTSGGDTFATTSSGGETTNLAKDCGRNSTSCPSLDILCFLGGRLPVA